jgi:hypothetical protein
MAFSAQPIRDVNIKPLAEREAWKCLKAHYRRVRGFQPRELFAADPKRGERFTAEGRIVGMKTFGASAPLKELQRKFGFEPSLVVRAAKQLLGR